MLVSKTEAEAGAGQKTESVRTVLTGPKKEPESPTLPPAGEESKKAAALINVPLHSGTTTDQTRRERANGPDHPDENAQVARMLIGTNDRPNLRPRTLHRGKRTAPLIDEGLTAPQGNAVLPRATEMPTTPRLVPQTGHQNRAALHPDQGPHPGEAAAAHLTSGGGMLTGRTHHWGWWTELLGLSELKFDWNVTNIFFWLKMWEENLPVNHWCAKVVKRLSHLMTSKAFDIRIEKRRNVSWKLSLQVFHAWWFYRKRPRPDLGPGRDRSRENSPRSAPRRRMSRSPLRRRSPSLRRRSRSSPRRRSPLGHRWWHLLLNFHSPVLTAEDIDTVTLMSYLVGHLSGFHVNISLFMFQLLWGNKLFILDICALQVWRKRQVWQAQTVPALNVSRSRQEKKTR